MPLLALNLLQLIKVKSWIYYNRPTRCSRYYFLVVFYNSYLLPGMFQMCRIVPIHQHYIMIANVRIENHAVAAVSVVCDQIMRQLAAGVQNVPFMKYKPMIKTISTQSHMFDNKTFQGQRLRAKSEYFVIGMQPNYDYEGMKRETLLTDGNTRGKLHVLEKFVYRGCIQIPPYLVASVRTVSVFFSELDDVCCRVLLLLLCSSRQPFGPRVSSVCVHDAGHQDTTITYHVPLWYAFTSSLQQHSTNSLV